MRDFSASEWDAIASINGLGTFDAIWELDIGWFEEPNQRRGGWSGVSRYDVLLPDGSHTGIFIKRQQNHTTRSSAHPFRGVPTFRREFRNLKRLQSMGTPVLEVLYFAEKIEDADRRAILISRELAGYVSFDACMSYWQQHGWPEKQVWHDLIHRIAGLARNTHRHRIQLNNFSPKHVFVGEADGMPDIRLIDLEGAKRRASVERAMLRDLDTFNRRSPGISLTDKLRFLLAYHQQPRVNRRVRKTWKKLVTLYLKKNHNQAQPG